MVGALETEKPKKTAEGRTITLAVKIQIVVDHFVNHDISECFFVKEVVLSCSVTVLWAYEGIDMVATMTSVRIL